MIPFHGSQPAKPEGHYESWFLRGNHPHEPQAFWIRYTRFIPGDKKRVPLGEIWAIWFDGDKDSIVTVKEEFPLGSCQFASDRLQVNIGDCALRDHQLHGGANLNGHRIEWALSYRGDDRSILFLPENLYPARLPRAKSVVSRPQVTFTGDLVVDGERITVDGWPGSENHNWGSRHTDQYAWGQVAAFDNAPDAFLECITAQVKIGPIPSPWMSIAVLRIGEEEFLFNSLGQAFRANGRYTFFDWSLQTAQGDARLDVRFHAAPRHFTALTYYNPSRGNKTCLNSKIAQCQATLARPGQAPVVLSSLHGAAFEILTDRNDHGRPLMT